PDTNIVRVGHLGGQTSRIIVQGSYAYFGRGSDLVIADISTPSQPRRVGKLTLPDYVGDIAIAGALAYVAAGRAGLRIVDIHDPAAPAELGAYVAPDPVASVAAGGGRAFLATNRTINTGYPPSGESTLYTLDVTNPGAPALIDTRHYASAYLNQLAVEGSFLYAVTYIAGISPTSSTLLVFDIAAPGAPTPAGMMGIGGYPGSMSIAGQRAYILHGDYQSELMLIVDLANPRQPVVRG